MVERGPGSTESIIDLTTRRRRSAAHQEIQGLTDGGIPHGEMLALPFLVDRLDSPNEQVRLWAAFQLVDRWQDHSATFIDKLWESPQEEIREAAISLIGKYRLEDYAFPLMRVFNSDDHSLKLAAGVALGRIGYLPAGTLLERWFEEAFSNPETNPLELEAAAESLLFHDHAGWWPDLLGKLDQCQQNHAFFSALFGQLCIQAESPNQLEQLASAYGRVRTVFNDVHLTQHLVATVGRDNVSRYLQGRLNGGYPLNAVYQEGLKVLGWDSIDLAAKQVLDELATCTNTQEGITSFLDLSGELLTLLKADPHGSAGTMALLRGAKAWTESWEDAILKVRELEFHLLLSLPLVTLLNQSETRCLADPESEALRITRIFQSPLLSPGFMGQVLNLIGHNKDRPGVAELGAASYSGWIRDEEKDALWKLYTGQLDGVDYPLEQVLPQPWDYPIPDLLPRLSTLLEDRFEGYLQAGRRQAIDYCLEVFRRCGSTTVVGVLFSHFDRLINQHFNCFLELITHIPDVGFLQRLVNHYRSGETDILRLIRFICDVHERPYPQMNDPLGEEEESRTWAGTARLLCRGCENAYEYRPEVVFVDEERLEQRQIPTSRDVWTPTVFHCKQCESRVPFDPDESFLADLFAELLASKLFGSDATVGDRVPNVHLVKFPMLEGKKLNPAHFFKEMERLGQRDNEEGMETEVLLELGRFQLEIREVETAKQTLHRILAGPNKCPLALYYLGVIAFQEKDLYEARVCFSRLLQSSTREDFGSKLDNPVDMAQHYLKLLDKREFKRSQFHLIST